MIATKGPLFEYACHEGNYGLVDILRGAGSWRKKPRKEFHRSSPVSGREVDASSPIRRCHISGVRPETTAPLTRETAGEYRFCRDWSMIPAGLSTICRPAATSGAFRSDFPTDASDPPLAIVRLRSSFLAECVTEVTKSN
jgi:hypothetical protein